MDDKRIADYFVVSGISDERCVPFDESLSQERLSIPKSVQTSSAPITDITVIIRSANESVPHGYTCLESTPLGFPADLNHGSLRSPSVYICFKRGRDKPPLVDIGVLYEGKERVMSDSEIVEKTFYGQQANVNNSGSRTFLTYRRARDNAPCNQLVVTDLCVILANKGESPPHAFCLINKNLNKGMVGSDVFICYKKSMNRPPLLCYKPSIIGRFPLDDYPHYPLPESVSLFCFPMGATVECWPKRAQLPKPIFSTYVLTSEAGEKVYGAAVTFYESLSDHNLSDKESEHLTYVTEEDKQTKSLHRIKSISILSQWPFFETFERFLLFLYKTFVVSSTIPQKIPIERYISNFMLEIPFPLPNRPKILVQLGMNPEETVLISQPPEYMPLALTGASFTQMLRNLGPENCLHVLLFALTEQKILLHSLRPDVLTSVAEAVVTMIFPFHWQCPYIPMCPLGLSDVLNAPLPFIVGVDSRYFDYFEPPTDVASIDLDTNSIYLSESKRQFNPKLMPKKPTRVLKSTLEKLFERLLHPMSSTNGSYNATNKTKNSVFGDNLRTKKIERQIELEIQEAFIKFMATILKNFRSYLLPITRAPTVGATDPSSLFDLQGFIKSRDKNYQKYYTLMMKTQMFTRFIEERSFVSDKNISLAFFDECSEKLDSLSDSVDSSSLRLLDFGDYIHNDQTVFIPPPEPMTSDDEFTYSEFGPFDPQKFHKHPTLHTLSRIGSLVNDSEIGLSENSSLIGPSSPMSKRTKQEIRSAQKVARRHADSPMTWSKCLLSYCYSLWFHHLPAYVKANHLSKPKPLSIAFQVLLRMQSLGFHPSDEVCYRVMMLLCGIYSEPILAVKVLFEMKAQKITPNAITYGYYNKAVLESKWPTGDTTASLMWNKLRNVIVGVAQFRQNTKIKAIKVDPNLNEIKSNSVKSFSDNGYVTNTDSINSESNSANRLIKDLKDFDSFRERTRSIVRQSSSPMNCLHDFDSAAGLLMTTDYSKFGDKNIICNDYNLRRRHKSAEHEDLNLKPNLDTNVISLKSCSPKPYLRSYSFGNDEKILQKLRSETLKELRQQFQQNEDENKKLSLNTNKNNSTVNSFKTIGGLTRCTEDPEEGDDDACDEIDGEVEVMKNWKHNLTHSKLIESQELDIQSLEDSSVTLKDSKINFKSSEAIDSTKSLDKSLDNSKTNNVKVIKDTKDTKDGLNSAFSPLKDALMNMELFASDGKVASTLRSSFRLASRFAKSSSPKTTITRSSTFHESNYSTSEKAINKFGALFRRDSQKSNSGSNSRSKNMIRSATLPPVLSSKLNDIKDTNNSFDNTIKLESQESVSFGSKDEIVTEDDSSRENSLLNLSAQWTNRLTTNKHSEYVYSTIKSAANNMANRFSDLKSSLASTSSVTSSPSKIINSTNASGVVTGVATGTANLLSQWASQLAEKFPSNLVFDDDDCSSNNSFDMRRNSFASEDEVSERSRDGSLGRNFTGFGINSNTSPLFELLDKHYTTSLEPKSLETNIEIVMEIVMTSCSRCYTCHAIIYDEEIMEGWTPDDSNLNTNCTFCSSKFVPLLTIILQDLKNHSFDIKNDLQKSEDSNKTLESIDEIDSSFNEENNSCINNNERQSSKLAKNVETFEPITVPYLSPLVLRKEIENVLNNEGDLCLAKPEFVDEHPIIYWNLIWYFKRINLPTHLPVLCLYSNTFNKNNTNNIDNFKLTDYQKVSVLCMWDNDRLHEEIGSSSLHKLWLETSFESPLVHALVTDERKPGQLTRSLMKQIINSIQCNDLATPMKLLITERLKLNAKKSNIRQHSIYRDLLFLSFVALGRENINNTAFDREYRRAFESMSPKDQEALKSIDKPPSIGIVFCRRFFKELELRPQSTTSLLMKN
ncbi:DENN domain-containing protein 4C-like [Oppia nitens]|uniref:DENN domain-containing protein 4C-like n=1 Tax=Oppia nitens TaxID=1686743 RepID=UPI0023DB70F9|nr:DENN domain-containing protein 4C-like [Oppia nitens]